MDSSCTVASIGITVGASGRVLILSDAFGDDDGDGGESTTEIGEADERMMEEGDGDGDGGEVTANLGGTDNGTLTLIADESIM